MIKVNAMEKKKRLLALDVLRGMTIAGMDRNHFRFPQC